MASKQLELVQRMEEGQIGILIGYTLGRTSRCEK